MKTKIYSLLVTCFFCAASLNAQINDTLKVLFIGNSYTSVNDLPQMFVQLSESGRKKTFVGSNTLPGYTLEGHSTDVTTLSKILQGAWDFVILQEQSQIPTIEYYRYHSMYPSAQILDSLITKQGANTVFFMTWGRKFGGQQEREGYYSPEFTDFFHMQDSLRSAYVEIANELSALVAPVGMAWQNAFTLKPSVDLWDIDNSHPTFKGSYLAACVFYAVLFHESPRGLSYTGSLNSEDAAFFQNIACQTVTSVEYEHANIPSSFKLFQNYPNPFNPSTVIRYTLPVRCMVKLEIFNILGQRLTELVHSEQNAGRQEIMWHEHVSSGIYIYRIAATPVENPNEQFVESKTMLFVR